MSCKHDASILIWIRRSTSFWRNNYLHYGTVTHHGVPRRSARAFGLPRLPQGGLSWRTDPHNFLDVAGNLFRLISHLPSPLGTHRTQRLTKED